MWARNALPWHSSFKNNATTVMTRSALVFNCQTDMTTSFYQQISSQSHELFPWPKKQTLTIKLTLKLTLTLKIRLILIRKEKKRERQNDVTSVWQMETSIYFIGWGCFFTSLKRFFSLSKLYSKWWSKTFESFPRVSPVLQSKPQPHVVSEQSFIPTQIWCVVETMDWELICVRDWLSIGTTLYQWLYGQLSSDLAFSNWLNNKFVGIFILLRSLNCSRLLKSISDLILFTLKALKIAYDLPIFASSYAFVIVSLTWLIIFCHMIIFRQRSKRYTLLSVSAVHQPFHISICISTLPTQHTTFIYAYLALFPFYLKGLLLILASDFTSCMVGHGYLLCLHFVGDLHVSVREHAYVLAEHNPSLWRVVGVILFSWMVTTRRPITLPLCRSISSPPSFKNSPEDSSWFVSLGISWLVSTLRVHGDDC